MRYTLFFILLTSTYALANDSTMKSGNQMSSGKSMGDGEGMAVAKDSMPEAKDSMPVQTGSMPVLKEGMPLSQGEMPSAEEEMPTPSNEMKPFLAMKESKPLKPQVNVDAVDEESIEQKEVPSAPVVTASEAPKPSPAELVPVKENQPAELSFFQKIMLFFKNLFN